MCDSELEYTCPYDAASDIWWEGWNARDELEEPEVPENPILVDVTLFKQGVAMQRSVVDVKEYHSLHSTLGIVFDSVRIMPVPTTTL